MSNKTIKMKLKRRGYILFEYCKGELQSFNICHSMNELKGKWFNEFDDNWDIDGRDEIHYFYLNLATGKYKALPKYLNNYVYNKKFEQCELRVLSTKTF